MSRFICLYFPDWDIQCAHRRQIGRFDPAAMRCARPLLLVKKSGSQDQIMRCCPQARSHGVMPGMALAQARSALPTAQVLPFESSVGERQLRRVAVWATRFTPLVELRLVASEEPFPSAPPVVLLDIQGAAHLFGGSLNLLKRIHNALRRSGLVCRAAAAPTPGAAYALAIFSLREISHVEQSELITALGPLPLDSLRLDSASADMLAEIGLQNIQELLAIPRAGIISRFSPQVLERLDQALGHKPEVFLPLQENPLIQVEFRADGPMTDSTALLLVGHDLAMRLSQELQQRGLGAGALICQGFGPDIRPWTMPVELAALTRDSAHFRAVLRPRMETLRLSGGVEILRLIACRTAPLHSGQEMFQEFSTAWNQKDSRQQESLGQTISILLSRLSRGQIHQPLVLESHAPEITGGIRPWSGENTAAYSHENLHITPMERPSLVLTEPEDAQSAMNAAAHIPATVQWRRRVHQMQQGLGPERITTPWWRRNTMETRDYFAARNQAGQWMWLFHERDRQRWFVQGLWL